MNKNDTSIRIDILKNHQHTIPALANIWYEVLGKTFNPRLTIKEIEASYLQTIKDNNITYIALYGEVPVGSCTMKLEWWNYAQSISDFVIDPKYQEYNIETMLIDRVVEKAKSRNWEKIDLFVFDSAAVGYEEASGWKKIGLDASKSYPPIIKKTVIRNLFPLQQHQKLLDKWKDIRPDKDSDQYWSQVVRASKFIKDYFINLESSQMFNNSILKEFDYNWVKNLKVYRKTDQAVDVTKIIGHGGHLKLAKRPYTWSEILLGDTLKCETLCYLIDKCVENNKLYDKSLMLRRGFIKFEGQYYLSGIDGLHRTTLAKYILSHNVGKVLYDVKVIEYGSMQR